MGKETRIAARSGETGSRLDWWDLRIAVCKAGSFTNNPEPQHWLESDAGPSYCWSCAIKAREEEFGLGPLLDPTKSSWLHTELEDAFFHGIDGGEWCSAECDGPEQCYTCGKTLHYWLTDYGIDEELAGFEDSEFSADLYEIAYSLDRLFELVEEDERRPRVRALAERFLDHADRLAPLPPHP